MRFQSICFAFFVFVCSLFLCSQSDAQLVITDPSKASEAIRQVSLNTPVSAGARMAEPRPIKPSDDLAQRTQIRVKVQYLMVDAATRQSIYAKLGTQEMKSTTHVRTKPDLKPLDRALAGIESYGQVIAPSRLTTCVMDVTQAQAIIQMATDATGSNVMRAPSVLLLDGKEAELNDLVQRPFVVDIHDKGEKTQPIIDVLDDGKRLRLLANLAGSEIEITAEVMISEIKDVKSKEVFLPSREAMTVQVPIHQVTTSIATELLASDQTLLMDPHITTTKVVESEAKVPVLGSLPLIGSTFRNTNAASVEQYLVVLLQPSIEPMER